MTTDPMFNGGDDAALCFDLTPRKFIVVDISPTAADAIRHKFNPSDSSTVAQIKDLTGTLITMLERLGPTRESEIAVMQVQTASMWAVLAATKGL